jgi:hypothetical protein
MFRRDINTLDVEDAIKNGEIIKSYLDDKPYPSFLILGFRTEKAIHLVIAKNEQENECIVVTTYVPDPAIWMDDLKMKR